MISYDKLWNTMKKRKISQYALKKKYGITINTGYIFTFSN